MENFQTTKERLTMARINENEKREENTLVKTKSSDGFVQTLSANERIPASNYEPGDVLVLTFLKGAINRKNGEIITSPTGVIMYPDWVFFKEVVGVYPSLPIVTGEEETDVYTYDVSLSAEKNIAEYLKKLKGLEDEELREELVNKAAETEFTCDYIMKYLKDESLGEEYVPNDKISINDVMEYLEGDAKHKFIVNNTCVLTQSAPVVTVSGGSKGTYRSGMFDLDSYEDPDMVKELLSGYSKLVYLVNDTKFRKSKQGVEGLAPDDYRDAKSKWMFSQASSIARFNNIRESGVAFAVQQKIDLDGEIHPDSTNRLVWYDLRESSNRINAIKKAIMVKNADTHISYVHVRFRYDTYNPEITDPRRKKSEAGRNLQLSECYNFEGLPATKYYENFSSVLMPKSFHKCAKFRLLNLGEIQTILKNWLFTDDVLEIVKNDIPMEDLESLRLSLTTLGYDFEGAEPVSIDDVISSLDGDGII